MSITKTDVENIQQVWGEGVVAIGDAHVHGKDYRTLATQHVDTLYAYGQSTVLFKPTKAAVAQFRLTRDSAISYFVGGNPEFPEDKGFAINPWVAVKFENADVITAADHALAMGNYTFTDPRGELTKVEYSFGYILDSNGKLKINLHHSSIPYAP